MKTPNRQIFKNAIRTFFDDIEWSRIDPEVPYTAPNVEIKESRNILGKLSIEQKVLWTIFCQLARYWGMLCAIKDNCIADDEEDNEDVNKLISETFPDRIERVLCERRLIYNILGMSISKSFNHFAGVFEMTKGYKIQELKSEKDESKYSLFEIIKEEKPKVCKNTVAQTMFDKVIMDIFDCVNWKEINLSKPTPPIKEADVGEKIYGSLDMVDDGIIWAVIKQTEQQLKNDGNNLNILNANKLANSILSASIQKRYLLQDDVKIKICKGYKIAVLEKKK